MLNVYFKTVTTDTDGDYYEFIIGKQRKVLLADVYFIPYSENPSAVLKGKFVGGNEDGPECINLMYQKCKSRYLYKVAKSFTSKLGVNEFKVYFNNNLVKEAEL